MEKINKKLKVYELVISENPDESGVEAVALVDAPAIEDRGMWLMFDKQKDFNFKASEPDKRIISGFLMVADMPIYRRDEVRGEYYVVFSKETIDLIRKKFSKQGYFNNLNVMHDSEAKVSGVYMLDSFSIGGDLNMPTPKGFDKAPEGSWYASYYVENQKIWDEFIKTGIFKGFSVEGMFGYAIEEKHSAHTGFIKMLDELINSI